MTAAFLLPSTSRGFAAAAAFERDERARLYPGQVREQKIAAERAQADYEAWAAIAAWCAGEPHPWCDLATMARAAARAVQAGDSAIAAAAGDPAQQARLEVLRAIHGLFTANLAFCTGLTTALRAAAAERKSAA